MVEILNATVIIRVIPALVRMVLNSFVMARFDMQFMKLQNGNSGGNLQNVIRKNLQKVEQKENVLRQEN